MDIKPEKMKLDIRQVSNPLYLGNVGDILHPKSPKVAVFERSAGIIIPGGGLFHLCGGPSVFVEIFGKKLKILNWSPITAYLCQWMANQLTDCCYIDWTSATSLGLERFFEIRYLPANSLLKILKCSMLYREWQIDLGPWTSCTHWDSVCCCFFAAFFHKISQPNRTLHHRFLRFGYRNHIFCDTIATAPQRKNAFAQGWSVGPLTMFLKVPVVGLSVDFWLKGCAA